ncbi:MAG: SurA N-terminal domain-containing protein [Deltaproteobacteria bacterium]|nr:SurA N-terminal domain-containing protein [Deltaproteobacteria bacterium]
MLRFIRQGQRWFVTALVATIGGVFILFFGPWDFSQSAGSTEAPISVDGVQFRREDVTRVRQNIEKQYRDTLGDQFDAVAANLQIQDRAVRQLIDRAILASEARRMGLAASDVEVDRMIRREFDGFRNSEGQLDEEQARAYVVYEWGSVRRFKDAVRTDLLLRKLGRVLLGSAGASRSQARDSLRYQQEEVRIAFVSLDPNDAPDSLEVVPGDVEEFSRTDTERIEAYYKENLTQYRLPERLHLQHVLVRVGDDGEDAARERAAAARARIEAGEDMASVARELSEDEGSKDLGGDLGMLPASDVAQALRDAVAELEAGELSSVVRGEQGFHIVRREDAKPEETRSLEDATLDIATELYRADQAAHFATERADNLRERIAGGQSLEEAARGLQLGIERTAFFRRRPDGYIPDLGDSMEAQTAAFSLGEGAPTWPHPLPVGNKTAFIQLLERRSPDAGEIEAQVDGELERLTEQAQGQAERVWLDERRAQLQSEGRISIDETAFDDTL